MHNYYFTNVYSLLIDNPQNEETVEFFTLPSTTDVVEAAPQVSEAVETNSVTPQMSDTAGASNMTTPRTTSRNQNRY
jgi:hypothetical protein